jgi:SAM-dependent methyltransferase
MRLRQTLWTTRAAPELSPGADLGHPVSVRSWRVGPLPTSMASLIDSVTIGGGRVVEDQGYFAADAEFQAELERLREMEAMSDPLTTRLLTGLGVRPGWRCLEIGAGGGSITRWLSEQVGPSGQVVAADIDLRFLADLTLPNVEVRRLDIVDGDLEAGAFDVVHCRFVLCHLGAPDVALRRMIGALRPGGFVLAEDLDATCVEPVDETHPLADGFMSAFSKRARWLSENGIMDMSFGKSLPLLMHRAGLVEVGNEGSSGIARGGERDSSMWLTMSERLDDYLMTEGLLSQSEVDATRGALTDPSFWLRNGMTVSAWGRRSG